MNQREFHRAVARATGESLHTIAQRGFVVLTPVPFEREPPDADYEEFLKDFGTPTGLPSGRRDAA